MAQSIVVRLVVSNPGDDHIVLAEVGEVGYMGRLEPLTWPPHLSSTP